LSALDYNVRVHPDDLRVPGSPREVSKFVDRAFAHYRGLGGRITRLRPYICPFEEVLRRIPEPGLRVLDVGCGVGIMSALAAGPGRAKSVVGFDVSPSVIEVARGIRLDAAGAMTFHALPPGAFPPAEHGQDCFDVVLCIDVLHHVPPGAQHGFLKEVCARVAPGGRLLFKDISPRPRWKALANRLHDLIIARQSVNYRSEAEISAWLAEPAEGQVLEAVRLDRLWYSHYLVAWRRTLPNVDARIKP
jgi:2-polyprenyl-3-methyl-5-hydroxy-6-metoxy-1,4-benzoquinol methylase